MLTIRSVVLKHQQKSDGTFNVKLRVTKNRESAYISTPYFVTLKQLDTKFRVIDPRLNIAIDDYILSLRKELSNNEGIYIQMSAKEIGGYLLNLKKSKQATLDYLDYLNDECSKLESQSKLNASNYKAVYNHLSTFTKGKLNFSELTPSFLYAFESYLRKEGIGNAGVSKYMGCIRASFNRAKNRYNDEDRGIIKIANNPFSKYTIPKEGESSMRDAGIDVVVDMYNFIPETELEELARDMFLLSFYLIGINAKDLHDDSLEIKKGRLTYQRSKTKDKRSDKAEISIKIEDEASSLLDKYKGSNGNVLSICERYKLSIYFNKSLSRGFKRIRNKLGYDNLTYYSARHSWATIASHNCDIIDSHIARCLNHKSIDFKTTNKYIKRDWSLIDKCNRQVLDFVKQAIEKKNSVI